MKTIQNTERAFFNKFGMTKKECDNRYLEMLSDIASLGEKWGPIYDICFDIRELSATEATSKPILIEVICGNIPHYSREVETMEEYSCAISEGIGYCLGINDQDGNDIVEPYMYDCEIQYND